MSHASPTIQAGASAPFPLTAHVAQFAVESRYEDLPDDVLVRGRVHMLDTLGLSLAGAVAPASEIMRDYLSGLGALRTDAQVFGTAMRAPARFAALLNGLSIHMDDYDDTNPPAGPGRGGGVHASASILAAVLAIAEREKISGRDVVTAYHVGVEIAAKLNTAISQKHYDSGHHNTGTINGLGVAAAVCRLLGADVDTTARAMGLAASQASGLRENFGTMTKPFHAGHAAECGLVSAELAMRGFSAAPNILEAPRGFFAVGGGYDEAAMVGKLGAPWAIVDPGSWLKPFPCGALTHAAMSLMLDLVEEHRIAPDQIEKIAVKTNKRLVGVLLHGQPADGLQAKFSLPFGLAVIALRGKAGLGEFTDEVVAVPEVKAMIGKVEHTAYETAGPDYRDVTSFLEVMLKDGQVIAGRVDFGKGSPSRPMTYEDVSRKVRDCADYVGWPGEKTKRLIALVQSIESLQDLGPLVETLARTPATE